ncbi:MAG: YolD-like family protein [Firmicutes bacterium]|nr:YolD-like family protein [Bacillota bacterium]
MHNFDRGMIKWQPFNSVISSKQMVNEVLNKKNKIKMPLLSDEQRKIIEDKIIIAYYENESVILSYYYQGNILHLNEKIKKIDFTYRKIYFNNKTIIFDQIISVN